MLTNNDTLKLFNKQETLKFKINLDANTINHLLKITTLSYLVW